jgi:2-deoxy-D-gluconate 3-dehydrogenase
VRELFDLTGRRALVTGGAGGLGRAMAEALVEAGAAVAVLGRSERTDVVAAELGAVGVRADATDPAELTRGVAEAVGRLGGLDVLVAGHGIGRRAPALEHELDDWEAVLATNLTSVFQLCRLAGRVMVEQGRGKIVTVASMLSFSGGLNVSSYAASKGGVAQLTKALANEWAQHGVNVNAIAPGYIATSNTEALRADPARNQAILDRIPVGRWGEAADIGGTAVFLASPAAKYIHGAIINVDGGWLAR